MYRRIRKNTDKDVGIYHHTTPKEILDILVEYCPRYTMALESIYIYNNLEAYNKYQCYIDMRSYKIRLGCNYTRSILDSVDIKRPVIRLFDENNIYIEIEEIVTENDSIFEGELVFKLTETAKNILNSNEGIEKFDL